MANSKYTRDFYAWSALDRKNEVVPELFQHAVASDSYNGLQMMVHSIISAYGPRTVIEGFVHGGTLPSSITLTEGWAMRDGVILHLAAQTGLTIASNHFVYITTSTTPGDTIFDGMLVDATYSSSNIAACAGVPLLWNNAGTLTDIRPLIGAFSKRILGDLTIYNDLTVKGNTSITGTLTATGLATLNGGIVVLTNKFTVDTSGNTVAAGTIGGSNLSGTNTGDITLTTIGSTANANGASLSSQQLQLQPASASYGGVITTGTQTIAGAKTFSNATDSSSTSTGAIITAGGIGAAGNAYIGGLLSADGILTATTGTYAKLAAHVFVIGSAAEWEALTNAFIAGATYILGTFTSTTAVTINNACQIIGGGQAYSKIKVASFPANTILKNLYITPSAAFTINGGCIIEGCTFETGTDIYTTIANSYNYIYGCYWLCSTVNIEDISIVMITGSYNTIINTRFISNGAIATYLYENLLKITGNKNLIEACNIDATWSMSDARLIGIDGGNYNTITSCRISSVVTAGGSTGSQAIHMGWGYVDTVGNVISSNFIHAAANTYAQCYMSDDSDGTTVSFNTFSTATATNRYNLRELNDTDSTYTHIIGNYDISGSTYSWPEATGVWKEGNNF